MFSIKLTELAYEDLEDISTYISQDLANPTAAIHFIDLVEKTFNLLKSNPYMHEICRDPLLASKGYRKAMIHNHVMIYAINILKGEVMILRIFYESRNNIPLL